MGLTTLLVFLSFASLAIIGLCNDELRRSSLDRSSAEWAVDLIGLLIQGVVIPAFPFLLAFSLTHLFPRVQGTIDLSPLGQFVMSFVLVDYGYYWNHRWFHGRNTWFLHRLHHSSRHLDVLATSRNSLVTSFLFLYVWTQAIGMFLLSESLWFMLGLGLTFALDLWRHCGITQPRLLHRWLGWALLFPEYHVLHHSVAGRRKNFGANFVWWDKLHGTFSDELIPNKNLERLSDDPIWSELFTPRKGTK